MREHEGYGVPGLVFVVLVVVGGRGAEVLVTRYLGRVDGVVDRDGGSEGRELLVDRGEGWVSVLVVQLVVWIWSREREKGTGDGE